MDAWKIWLAKLDPNIRYIQRAKLVKKQDCGRWHTYWVYWEHSCNTTPTPVWLLRTSYLTICLLHSNIFSDWIHKIRYLSSWKIQSSFMLNKFKFKPQMDRNYDSFETWYLRRNYACVRTLIGFSKVEKNCEWKWNNLLKKINMWVSAA